MALEWGESYRPLGRRALAEIIEGRMAEAVDCWLDSLDGSAMRDRRKRLLLAPSVDRARREFELSVPRTRRFCPTGVLRSHAMRAAEADRAILAGFVLGLSTRKVGEVLLSLLGHKVFAARRENRRDQVRQSGASRQPAGSTSLDPEAASPETDAHPQSRPLGRSRRPTASSNGASTRIAAPSAQATVRRT